MPWACDTEFWDMMIERVRNLPKRKEPRWFAYFDDGYDSRWMESYHTKKEALADIKIHKESFDCLIKGKIVK